MKQNGTQRQAAIHRATKETDIRVEWMLDGSGQGKIETSIRFFDHMLELLSKHGFFDLTVQAKGDIDIDEHHTVEDVGIVMGKALHQAVGVCGQSAAHQSGVSGEGWVDRGGADCRAARA
jgi:imidazoleglycerol-phosphate dehydratase